MVKSKQISYFVLILVFSQTTLCYDKESKENNESDYERFKEFWEKNIRSLERFSNEERRKPDVRFKSCMEEVLAIPKIKNHIYLVKPGSAQNLIVIKACCPGYEEYKFDTNQCVPKCDDDCPGGYCAEPNKCSCFPHDVPDLSGNCVPTCPIGCVNGHCHANGTCTCNPGYMWDEFRQLCIPICNGGCPPGLKCTAPGICSCMNGYKMSMGRCEPICTASCLNGICVGPDLCSCDEGYFLKDDICQAECVQNCTHGECVAPNICNCHRGYMYDQYLNDCIPSCRSCENGKCTAPGVCKCPRNYYLKNGKCEPICLNCDNGDCIALDVCMCHRFYSKTRNGKCVLDAETSSF